MLSYIVKGRISNVRWLETEFGAIKVRGEKGYWNYRVALADDARLRDVLDRIDGGEHGETGCWYEQEWTDADQAELEADERAEQAERDAKPLHAAWANIATYLASKGQKATNETCAMFAQAQVEHLFSRNRYGATAQRLQQLLWDLADDGAGDAWIANREWLKTLKK